MPNSSLAEWLAQRVPEVPGAFLPHLLVFDGEEGGRDALTTWGIQALASALGCPGRDRPSAFRLLTADAFLTYACEVAADEKAVREGLEAIILALGARFPR